MCLMEGQSMSDPAKPLCPDYGIPMAVADDGTVQCAYCNSWAFLDPVSDGAIYAAVSRRNGER